MNGRKHFTGSGMLRQMTKLQEKKKQTNKQTNKLARKAEMEKMKDPNYMF